MSSRYDSRTTTFSPQGRLFQVEYAMEGLARAPTALAIVTANGIVFAAERRERQPLLDVEQPVLKDISGEKVFKVDDHVSVGVAGLTADANLLTDYARRQAQQHKLRYNAPMPVEDLCQMLCDVKQMYTQYGGVRPFGIAFLVGGWDRHRGFQLYMTDPSGNYTAWKATAVGRNENVAQGVFKTEWAEDMSLEAGILLALKVLGKTLDTAQLNCSRLEVACLTRAKQGYPGLHILSDAELGPHIDKAETLRKAEEEKREAARKNRDD